MVSGMVWFQQLTLSWTQPRHGLGTAQAKGQPQQAIFSKPHCLESKNLIMWTQATLCQLASELESGHRHVLYRWSLRVFLSHQVLCFLSCCHLSISFILQITKRILFLCQVSSLSALLTDQSLPLAGLFLLLFDSLTAQLCPVIQDCSVKTLLWNCQEHLFLVLGHLLDIRLPAVLSFMAQMISKAVRSHVPQEPCNVVFHIKIHQMSRGRTFSPIIISPPRKMNLWYCCLAFPTPKFKRSQGKHRGCPLLSKFSIAYGRSAPILHLFQHMSTYQHPVVQSQNFSFLFF